MILRMPVLDPCRIRLSRRLVATLAASALALPAAAAHASLEVSLSPVVATWQDRVTVTVSGTVVTSCGPDVLSLRAGHPLLQPGPLVALELVAAPCDVLAPPSAHPFRVSFELPPLEPGEYQVRVDGSATGVGVATAPLAVHHSSSVQLLVPDLARSDEPVDVSVRSFAGCASVDVTVTGNLVEIDFAATCIITPPGPMLREEEVDLGLLAPGLYEVRLLDFNDSPASLATASFRVWDAAGCVPSSTALCLHDGRFRLEVTWRDFQGGAGPGRPIPLAGRDDSGLFWFFHPENVELTAKVIDACALDGRFWVFVSSGSTVEYELTVTDTLAGESVRYRNELGAVPGLIADTAAFTTCP